MDAQQIRRYNSAWLSCIQYDINRLLYTQSVAWVLFMDMEVMGQGTLVCIPIGSARLRNIRWTRLLDI